jgi:hypothetical protein
MVGIASSYVTRLPQRAENRRAGVAPTIPPPGGTLGYTHAPAGTVLREGTSNSSKST